MTKLERLRKEALKSCQWRGHVMTRFYGDKLSRFSDCKNCGRYVVITAHPLPNDIEIGGSAIALNCDNLFKKGL